MLDPTGIMAVVNSCIAFFKAVQSVLDYMRELLELIDSYVSTVAQIAKGNVGPGAAMLETGLANAVPVAIGFLANQAGLGDVPEQVKQIIIDLRAKIVEAIDWLIDKAVGLAQSALDALGGDKEQDDDLEAEVGVQYEGAGHEIFAAREGRPRAPGDGVGEPQGVLRPDRRAPDAHGVEQGSRDPGQAQEAARDARPDRRPRQPVDDGRPVGGEGGAPEVHRPAGEPGGRREDRARGAGLGGGGRVSATSTSSMARSWRESRSGRPPTRRADSRRPDARRREEIAAAMPRRGGPGRRGTPGASRRGGGRLVHLPDPTTRPHLADRNCEPDREGRT